MNLLRFANLRPRLEVDGSDDGATVRLMRGRHMTDRVRLGPNEVHFGVIHVDGSYDDCGVSKNLLTNIGRDWLAGSMGGFIPAGGAGSPATATSGTSITATATPWTASNLATPQLGLAGLRVYAPVTGITTAPVYGNIVSNTTSVATIDQWWTAADGVGTTPASTNAFIIGAGGLGSARFMGLTANASAAAAASTTLTGEITTGGCNRQLAAYAHTFGAATYTLTKAFTVTGSFTLHRGGLFTTVAQAGADPMIFETVANADAIVVNGDTVTATWTVTLAG